MKKTLYSFMAFATIAMTVASCSSDIENNNTPAAGEKVAKTFSATQETSGASSRTAFDATDATKVNWLSTDAITVWDGTAKNAFTVAPKSDATTADISGSVTSGSESFTAVYPNSVGQSCTYSEGSITDLVIPATQTATAGTFDPAAAIMVAQTTNENLAFKHVCSFLKITTAAAYTKIVVSTTSGSIAGTFTANASSGAVTAPTGSTTVTLNPAGSATTIAAGTYYIAIAPGTVTDLNVKCYTDATSYVEKSKSGNVTFSRAASADLGETTGWTAPAPTYAYVDLGLTVLWATCNVGASSPEEYGDYFAWGEITPYYTEGHSQDNPCSNWQSGKTGYNYASYSLCNGSSSTLTKYNNSSSYGAVLDHKTTLESSDDAASVNMGGTWRMPTGTEMKELFDNCYFVHTTNYNGTNKSGYIVYKAKDNSDKGKHPYYYYDDNEEEIDVLPPPTASYSLSDTHIFLPAACYRNDKNLSNEGYGYYLSSSIDEDNPERPFLLSFGENIVWYETSFRCLGFSVRAVCP